MAKPEKKFQIGSACVSIFLNQGDRPFRTADVHRRYKTEGGEWSSSSSFTLPQLVQLREAIDTAIEYLKELEGTTSDE